MFQSPLETTPLEATPSQASCYEAKHSTQLQTIYGLIYSYVLYLKSRANQELKLILIFKDAKLSTQFLVLYGSGVAKGRLGRVQAHSNVCCDLQLMIDIL